MSERPIAVSVASIMISMALVPGVVLYGYTIGVVTVLPALLATIFLLVMCFRAACGSNSARWIASLASIVLFSGAAFSLYAALFIEPETRTVSPVTSKSGLYLAASSGLAMLMGVVFFFLPTSSYWFRSIESKG